MSAPLNRTAETDARTLDRIDQRRSAAQPGRWRREIDQAWRASQQGISDAGADFDAPAEAGQHASRAGTTRYSAPAHALLPRASGAAEEDVDGPPSVSLFQVQALQYEADVGDTPGALTKEKRTPAAMADTLMAASVPGAPVAPQGSGNAAGQSPAKGATATATSNLFPIGGNDSLCVAGAVPRLGSGSNGGPIRGGHRPVAVAPPFIANPIPGIGVDRAGMTQPAGILAAGAQATGASGVAQAGTPQDELEELAEHRPEEVSSPSPAEQAEDVEDYASKHVHVHLDEDGIHAYVRDAHLEGDEVFALAQAIYEQGMFGQASLATLTVNGRPVPRTPRASASLTSDSVHAEPDTTPPPIHLTSRSKAP